MTAGWETRDGRADMTNFEMDLFDTRMSNPDKECDDDDDCCKHSIIKPACLPITILALLLLMTFFIPLFNEEAPELAKKYEKTGICTDECSLEIVESIPDGMKYFKAVTHLPTFDAWSNLLMDAEKSIDMAVLYWNLRDPKNYKTSWQGNQTFENIIDAAKRGVKIRIAQNAPSTQFPQTDSEYFIENGLAEVRNVNFTDLFGSGVLHTKIWIVDQLHIYIGSANMDWKSLTEVKELGVVIRNCSCMASDIGKIFTIYWRLGEEGARIPTRWPINLRTNFNFKRPLGITFNSLNLKTFLSSAPIEFNPKGREYDLNAIVNLMNNATKYIRVAVMDYLPTTLYMGRDNNRFWPNIDDALRSAAFRGLNIQLLISQWRYSKRAAIPYLKSLLQINPALRGGRIDIKLFTVPADEEQKKLEFARVNHNKFMVTDSAAYIGTSNWVGDYFITTAGIGLVIESTDEESQYMIEDFNDIFLRDWNSTYASPLTL